MQEVFNISDAYHLLFIFLAAFFNAVMDMSENENFFESIFRKWRQSFWYKRESWKTSKRIFGYKLDAWHIAKSCMIISFVFAIYFAPDTYLGILLILDGLVWNATFFLFYHKIFGIR